jgi:hypothetical protein
MKKIGLFLLIFVSVALSWQNWVLVTDSAPWSPRTYYCTVVFHDTLWLIGGTTLVNDTLVDQTNDIWCTTDGRNWIKVTDSAPWLGRTGHTCVVFRDTLWLLGGVHFSNPYRMLNDIWCTTDGRNWIKVTDSAPWSVRYCHATIVFHDTLWLLGGIGPGQPPIYPTDIWKSSNGRNWILVTDSAPYGRRGNFDIVSLRDTLWLIGGDSRPINSVWCSPDGYNWECILDSAPWSWRVGYASLVVRDSIWLLGGIGNFNFNDIWCTANGRNWIKVTDSAPWRPRDGHTVTFFHDTLWLMGGWKWSWLLNDVWYLDINGGAIEETKPFTQFTSLSSPTIIRDISRLRGILFDPTGRKVVDLKSATNKNLKPGIYFLIPNTRAELRKIVLIK